MTTNRELGLQKVCDIHDFFHPDIDHILRKELESVPFGSRRAWEFAMIFRALQKKGKLHGEAVGLAMGAGTERLIYSIARIAKKTVVTDLYLPDSGWVGVRTNDPQGLVMSKAPWKIEPGCLEAMAMDMRDLKFPDESFDFCWSTGAFEHIGDDGDFARHLSEVHRVLKPGGVYAFTTAVVFGPRTLPIPHNYYFHPEHLIDLLHASPLHAESDFDCRVTDHIFNRPHIERFEDYGFPAGDKISKPVISFRRGALVTANVMVLTKAPGKPKKRPKVVGFEATFRQLRRHVDVLTSQLWKDYQVLRPEAEKASLVVQPQYFGTGKVVIDVMLGNGAPAGVNVIVRSRPIDDHKGWKTECTTHVTATSRDQILLETSDTRVYGLTIVGPSREQASRIVVRARHARKAEQQLHHAHGAGRGERLGLRGRLELLRRALT